tara:strand:- start:6140 stop:6505 length:366 start_codon:yes stop_codon:yes gene_type:complete
MRKITRLASKAFKQGKSFSRDNTLVKGYNDGLAKDWKYLYLHGNCIAKQSIDNGELLITLAGWPTPTTRERLNGLLQTMNQPIRLYQHKHEQYLWNYETNKKTDMPSDWLSVNEVAQELAI